MQEKINIVINVFGVPINKNDIPELLKEKSGSIDIESKKEILKDFFKFSTEVLSKEILERYLESSHPDMYIPIVPHYRKIVDKIVQPLKSAKYSYCLEEYVSTVSLCGLVGEMLAILTWKIKPISLNGRILNEEDEKILFGSSFEKLSQKKRLNVLKGLELISKEQEKMFNNLRNSRRPYLHLWTSDMIHVKEISFKCLKDAFILFKQIFEIKLIGGSSITINPLILRLIKENKT